MSTLLLAEDKEHAREGILAESGWKGLDAELARGRSGKAEALPDSEGMWEIECAELLDRLALSLPALKCDMALRLCRAHSRGDDLIASIRIAEPEIQPEAPCMTILLKLLEPRRKESSREPVARDSAVRVLRSRGFREVSAIREDGIVVIHACQSVLLGHPNLGMSVAAGVGAAIAEALADAGGAFVAIGPVVQGISNARLSYETAERAMRRSFYHRKGRVLSDNLRGASFNFSSSIAGTFRSLVIEGKVERILNYIRELERAIESRDTTPVKSTKAFFTQLAYVLAKSGELIGRTSMGREAIDEAIHEAGNLADLSAFLIESTERLFASPRSPARGRSAVTAMKDFIADRYGDPRLSLGMMASALSLSAPHTCVLFKAESGRTVSRYIREYRIGKAKELLAEEGARIKEVAAAVGYTDYNYFSKIFRSETGLSPMEYAHGQRP